MRLEQHLSNSTDKYTGKAKDWILKTVFEVSSSEGDAMKIERFIKKQKSRKLILQLCDPEFIPTGTLAQLVRHRASVRTEFESSPALAGSKTKVNRPALAGFLF